MCLRKKADGKLTIDLYGDDEPLKLQLNLDIYELMERKRIVLDVENVDRGFVASWAVEEDTQTDPQ